MVLPYKWFRLPFGVAGTLAAIPDATQPDGSVSYNEGFGPDYALDPGTNPAALNIPRDKSNQLYNDITTALQYLQAGNVPAWIASADNGGTPYSYGFLAKVLYTDGYVYTSVVAANTATPGASANWVRDRVRLNAAATIYVNTSGSDTTGTGTSGNPYRTVQFAVNLAQSLYDLNGQTITFMRQASTTYTDAVILNGRFAGQTSPAQVVFDGASMATVTTTVAIPYQIIYGGMATVQNQKLVASTGLGYAILSAQAAVVNYNNIDFGTCISGHVSAVSGGYIQGSGNYTISGGGSAHAVISVNGVWVCNSVTVTLTGTPAFTTAFCKTSQNGTVNSTGVTFSGSATGARYNVDLNGVIQTSGAGANYFPGNSAGVTATGGQYA